MVTIRDVAKASGFSSSTVSIVLNDAPLARYIPPTTKTRIQQAAKKLGYRPNLFARSLRGKRNREVGVMVFDITDPYCTPILRGIQNALYDGSYLPILTDAQNERARFLRYLERRGCSLCVGGQRSEAGAVTARTCWGFCASVLPISTPPAKYAPVSDAGRMS